jgi:hypothetical protein
MCQQSNAKSEQNKDEHMRRHTFSLRAVASASYLLTFASLSSACVTRIEAQKGRQLKTATLYVTNRLLKYLAVGT